MKRWKYIWTAAILSMGLLMQSIPVLASDGISKNGSFHIDQFGEYDVFATVEVKEGLISNVNIEGKNFGGNYVDVNEEKLLQATDGMIEKLKGLSAKNAKEIMEVEAVSGATVSSNGIKRAVLNALELKEESVPIEGLEKTPEAGEYEVTVSVKSDVIEHSLVETETATAKLKVDESGEIQLSYRMISGTEKEPMYVLEFNGYYQENDRTNSLIMDGVSVEKESKGVYEVATDVTFPLSDLSGTYYANSKIYVPAMSNVNGLISGVSFENGTFDIDNIITVYWDTLKLTGNSTTANMEITATIEETENTPEYSVIIPEALSMGTVSASKDNVIEYEIKVRASKEDTVISVSAPEEGQLLKEDAKRSKKGYLMFRNDFGTQTVKIDKEQKEENTQEYCLKGNIRISAEEVQNASVGSYSGTTLFTINYNKNENKNTSDDTPKLDIKNLADGVYSVTGDMVKADKKTYSMSNNAINHTIKLTVKNGKYYITLDLNGMTIGQKLGYLSQLKYFTTGYTLDKYGNPQGTLMDVTIDSYQKNSDGALVSDSYGTNYPDKVTFELIPEALEDGYVPLQVFVPIMESIATGNGTQPVFLRLDWSTLKATTSDDSNFDDNNDNNNNNNNKNNSNSNGNNNSSLGNNTLGKNNSSLGNFSLLSGSSSLKSGGIGSSLSSGTSSLKSGNTLSGGSSLKSAANAKTEDTIQSGTLWSALLLLGGVGLMAVFMDSRKKKKTK